MWAVVVVGVAAAGAFAWARVRPAPPLRPPPSAVPREAPAYRVVYRVTAYSGPTPAVSTDVVEARRPFEAHVVSRAGPPPGGDIQSGSVQNRQFFWNLTTGGQVQFGVMRGPGIETHDISLGILREAARRGRVKEVGRRTVLGRSCTTFSYFQFRPAPLGLPTRREHVDPCVTDDGILLREDWTLVGKLARVREAVEVDGAPRFDDATFFIGRTPEAGGAASLVTSQQAVQEGKVPGGTVLRPRLPTGFALDRLATVASSGGGGGPSHTSYVESYVRGSEAASVEQGAVSGGDPPWVVDEGQKVDAGRFARGRLLFFVDEVELRAWKSPKGPTGRVEFARVDAPSADIALYLLRTLSPRGR